MMGWIFAIVLIICITIIAYKVIDDSVAFDMWKVERSHHKIQERIAEIEHYMNKMDNLINNLKEDDK